MSQGEGREGERERGDSAWGLGTPQCGSCYMSNQGGDSHALNVQASNGENNALILFQIGKIACSRGQEPIPPNAMVPI